MTDTTPITEFHSAWLPNISDAGLRRLSKLLESSSPLLIRGMFAGIVPMGCLASHVAWNHPATAQLHDEAGVVWLTKVARLNPATSRVILAWDEADDWQLRQELLAACREEIDHRAATGDRESSVDCGLACVG